MDLSHKTEFTPASFFAAGYHYSVPLDKWNIAELACDYIFVGKNKISFEIPGTLGIIQDGMCWAEGPGREQTYPIWDWREYTNAALRHKTINFLKLSNQDCTPEQLEIIKSDPTLVVVLESNHPLTVMDMRSAYLAFIEQGVTVPIINKTTYSMNDEDQFMLYSATDQGALFIDGLGDGTWISAPLVPLQRVNSTAFGILQATRTRISKTEYISCPSCGRTLFDLQETTAKIRQRTSHLKGVKIGIMGCIVNGPGEMADADYGYVGTGPGKITLYKEKEVVKKNVPESLAVEELINLIKEHGDWVEPK
jgi:(E)-4-hydroxy-3-methylbut-2-enyl-diphosphate synthase